MKEFELIANNESGLPTKVININEYYNQNKEAIDRYEINKGKVKYDIDQNRLIEDVVGISKNAIGQVYHGVKESVYNLLFDPIEYDNNKSIAEQLEEQANKMEKQDLKVKEATSVYSEAIKKYKEDMDIELGNEFSPTQSFVAGTAFHMARQMLDIRQAPYLYVSTLTGGLAGKTVGSALKGVAGASTGKIVGQVFGNALEEMGEEAIDQVMTYGKIVDKQGIAVAGVAGGVLGGVVPAVAGKGFSKFMNISSELSVSGQKAASNIYGKARTKYIDTVKKVGNEIDVKLGDLKSISENLSRALELRGKYLSPEDIKKTGVIVEGITVREADEFYTPTIINYITDNNLIKGIDNWEKFSDYVGNPDNEESFLKLIQDIAKRKDLTYREEEAFNWAVKVLDRNRVPEIDVNTKAVETLIDDSLENKGKFDNIEKPQEIEYPFSEMEVELSKFEEISKDRIKHNPKDFSKKQLIRELTKDMNIPEGAKVISVGGNVPKTKVPIKSGINSEGNPVYTRAKWIKDAAEADIMYDYNGERYYKKATWLDGKWRGDTYRTRVTPETPVETSFRERTEKDIWETFKKRYVKDIGLNKKVSEFTPDDIRKINLKIMEDVGKTVKEKYNFKSLDEMIDFYKQRYGIEFNVNRKKLKKSKTSERLGETNVWIDRSTGTPKTIIDIGLNENIKNGEQLMGVLRHEIQHVIDEYNNPNFNSTSRKFVINNDDIPYIDYLEQTGSGHFAGHPEDFWEVSYIISNQIDNIFGTGKPNVELAKNMGLDIPNNTSKEYVEFMAETVNKTKNMNNVAERLKEIQKASDNFLQKERGFRRILKKDLSPGQRTKELKNFIITTIVNPFRIQEAKIQSQIYEAMKTKIDGNILDIQKNIDLWENNNGNLFDFLFGNGQIPEKLTPYEDQFLNMKKEINKIIDNVSGDELTRADIIAGITYDANHTIEKILGEEEVKKYKGDKTGEIDFDKLNGGEKIFDIDTDMEMGERTKGIIDTLADNQGDIFNDARTRLTQVLSIENNDPQYILDALRNAKGSIPIEELQEIINTHRLYEIDEIRDFLDKYPKFFIEGKNIDFNGNNISNKRKNSKKFFIADMGAWRGESKNSKQGTYAHKFGRFEDAIRRGYISPEGVSNLIMANKVSQRVGIQKFFNWIPSASAIKTVFPDGKVSNINKAVESAAKHVRTQNLKTYTESIKRIFNTELGEELGFITREPLTNLDKTIKGFLKWTNMINLSGPKAFREFFQEGLAMSRGSVMNYGGGGVIQTAKDIMQSLAYIHSFSNDIEKIDKILGGRFKERLPLEFFNSLDADIKDVTGWRKERILKYGNRFEKISATIENGANKLNWYHHTQEVLELASYMKGGRFLENITKYTDIDTAIKNTSNVVKEAIENLEITDVDFQLLKKFKDTKAFKEYKIFDEIEFKDTLKKEDYFSLFGRNITDREFNILKDETTRKALYLYEELSRIVSPTETSKSTKLMIETNPDVINRNFQRLTENFKNSVQVQWGRAIRDYKDVNLNELGKFDWGNTLYYKRLTSRLLGIVAILGAADLVTDSEFYADPLDRISEKIDDLFDNPGSEVWNLFQEQNNLWTLTTGSNAIRRPIQLGGQIAKGDFKKAAATTTKMFINATNYEMGKYIYDNVTK